jgi:hypothetical protein
VRGFRNPLSACLVLAGLMHATASLVLWHVRLREYAPEPRQATAEPPNEVMIEEVPAPELEPTATRADRAEERDEEQRAASVGMVGTHASLGNGLAALTVSRTEAGGAPSDLLTQNPSVERSQSADDWAFHATVSAPNLFAGASPFLAKPLEAPPRANPSAVHAGSRTGGLVEGLDARDVRKGLGRGGPVLSAVEEAAHSADAPTEGFAEYEVIVRRTGSVEVFLLRANDNREKWAEIRPTIKEGVSVRHVVIPSGASGMRYVVRVDAVLQFPDGKHLADLGNKTIATTGWGGKEEPGLSSPGVPMVGIVHTGKVCSIGAAITPGMLVLGGGCSLENIGRPAVRMVHGRVMSESRVD